MWAESIRRGAFFIVPGSLKIRLPVFPLSSVDL